LETLFPKAFPRYLTEMCFLPPTFCGAQKEQRLRFRVPGLPSSPWSSSGKVFNYVGCWHGTVAPLRAKRCQAFYLTASLHSHVSDSLFFLIAVELGMPLPPVFTSSSPLLENFRMAIVVYPRAFLDFPSPPSSFSLERRWGLLNALPGLAVGHFRVGMVIFWSFPGVFWDFRPACFGTIDGLFLDPLLDFFCMAPATHLVLFWFFEFVAGHLTPYFVPFP